MSEECIPDFILKHTPIVYLHKDDEFFPGDPVEHLKNVTPKTLEGLEVNVPEDKKTCVSMLELGDVCKRDVFLTLKHDVRANPRIPELQSTHCKPDEHGRSKSPVFILYSHSKSEIIRGKDGTGQYTDAFYFFFYPYNLGNKVLFNNFGNHVGDWEHAMIRFCDEKPKFMHLSAHSDGNSWAWDLFEKEGDRPVIYAAGGSHAMYAKPGTHNYSGIFLVGPQDYTSKGFRWDPLQNFVCAEFGPWWNYKYTVCNNLPGHNKTVTKEQVLTILKYEGRWGNSFSDLRKPHTSSLAGIKGFVHKVAAKVMDPADKALEEAEQAAVRGEGAGAAQQAAAQGAGSLSLFQKLLILIWAEGPTGPRDKDLDRKNMNRWENRECLKAL